MNAANVLLPQLLLTSRALHNLLGILKLSLEQSNAQKFDYRYALIKRTVLNLSSTSFVSFAPLRNHRIKSKKLQGFASYSKTSVRSQRLHYLDTQRRLLWLHYKETLEGYTTDLKCKDTNEATNRKKNNPNWTLSNRRTTKFTIRILKVRIVDGGTDGPLNLVESSYGDYVP